MMIYLIYSFTAPIVVLLIVILEAMERGADPRNKVAVDRLSSLMGSSTYFVFKNFLSSKYIWFQLILWKRQDTNQKNIHESQLVLVVLLESLWTLITVDDFVLSFFQQVVDDLLLEKSGLPKNGMEYFSVAKEKPYF